jgi:catechol 2,3-dioxygenase-like lactoylglutathione lyase family enzyme
MAKSASGTFHHTCFLVRDVDATAARLSASIGIGPWHVWTIAPAECTVHGQPGSYSFRVALAEHGGASYELLAPISGHSVYTEHLEAQGEGFHHTCHIFPTREAMEAAQAELAAQGRDMIQSGSSGEAFAFCYFTIPETGSTLELLYLAGLPPPDRAIG